MNKHSTSSFEKLTLHSSRERGHWASHTESLLSCIGMTVGLGNLWRFPTLAYQTGGAFFIPYIILQSLVGTPVYFIELAMGQYCGLGPVGIFDRFNPFAKGISVSMTLIVTVTAMYYNCIMAICLYYMFASMQGTLPWTSCKPEWIENHCIDFRGGPSMRMCGSNITKSTHKDPDDHCRCTGDIALDFNVTAYPAYVNVTYEKLVEIARSTGNMSDIMLCTNHSYTPAHFYFYDEVIRQTGSDLRVGFPIWHLSLCLLLSSVMCVACQLKGIRSTGKVVYFTVIFPYVVLLILLVRLALLEGATDGVKFFFIPNWHQLKDIRVWLNVGGQVFFSLGLSNGIIMVLGSYNRIHWDVYRDSIIITTVDFMTSFLGGLVVFMTLGSMAHDTGQKIEDVAAKGLGLAFVVYPEALSKLPVPQLWSFLFFFMLYTLGLDSLFAMTETIMTILLDEIPRFRRDTTIVTIFIGIVLYAVSMVCVTPGGSYIVDMLDTFVGSYPTYVVCCCEVIAVAWTYGYRRFLGDIYYMLGYHPHPQYFWAVCWVVAIPIATGIIVIAGFIDHKPLTYTYWAGPGELEQVPFGPVAQLVCWLIMAIVLLPIPAMAIYAIVNAPGNHISERIQLVTTPLSTWAPQKDDSHKTNRWITSSSKRQQEEQQ